jgi:hypothetical protein
VEVDSSLDRALEERDRTVEGDTRRRREGIMSSTSPRVVERKRPVPPFFGSHTG